LVLITTLVTLTTLANAVRVQHANVGQLLPRQDNNQQQQDQQGQTVGQMDQQQDQGQTVGQQQVPIVGQVEVPIVGQRQGQTGRQQQSRFQGQQQGQTSGQEKLHQCTCDDQYKGIHEWKDFFTECSNQCRVSEADGLKLLIDSPVKLYSCIDQKVELVHHLFDCLNSKLIAEDSCVSTASENYDQMLTYQDFRQMLIGNIEPLLEDLYNTYENIDPNFMDKFGYIFLDNCSRTCVFDKIVESPTWDRIKCLPKIQENKILQLVQQCYRDVNYQDMIYKICTCSVGVGVNALQPFCQQLRTAQYPQWAQSQEGMVGDQQFSGQQMRGQFGQSGQFGQLGQLGQSRQFGQLGQFGQYLLGPKLLVKLAIQQEQPLFGGLGQGQSQEFGKGISQGRQTQGFGGGFNQGQQQGMGGGFDQDQGQESEEFSGRLKQSKFQSGQQDESSSFL